jgi:hypothetical protein
LPCRWLLDPPDDDPPDEDPADEDPADDVDDPPPMSGVIGIGGRLSRSAGISGGGIGGWPLIRSGPLALLSNVAQPPLPRVAPMLQATWRLPADQLGNDSVL